MHTRQCFSRERQTIGLGEMTFLQLSTTYSRSVGGRSVGFALSHPSSYFMLIPLDRYFASGTGAAGIVGAFMWWELRGLGVSTGVGISAVTI